MSCRQVSGENQNKLPDCPPSEHDSEKEDRYLKNVVIGTCVERMHRGTLSAKYGNNKYS